MLLVGGDYYHSHHDLTWAIEVQAYSQPSQEGSAEYYVILHIHEIKVFLNIAATKHNGGMSTIIYSTLVSYAGQLQCDWLLQHKGFHACHACELKGYHYPLAPTV
jgi:hypothetical protein